MLVEVVTSCSKCLVLGSPIEFIIVAYHCIMHTAYIRGNVVSPGVGLSPENLYLSRMKESARTLVVPDANR